MPSIPHKHSYFVQFRDFCMSALTKRDLASQLTACQVGQGKKPTTHNYRLWLTGYELAELTDKPGW